MSTNTATVLPLSLQAARIIDNTATSHHVRFFAALPGTVTNLIVIWVIWRSKQLRTKFFVHAASVALADFFMCLSNVFIAGDVLAGKWFGMNTITTALVCQLVANGWFAIGQRGSQVSNLLMAIDRLIAIQWPLFYSHMNWRYVIVAQIVCWLFAVATSLKSIIQAGLQDGLIALCSYLTVKANDPTDVAFQAYMTYTLDAAILLTLILTVLALLWVFKRRRADFEGTWTTQMKTEVKTLWVVLVTCILFLFAWAINQFTLGIVRVLVAVTSDQLQVISNYLQTPMLLYCSSTLVIYVTMLKVFRIAFLSAMRCKPRTRVAPLRGSQQDSPPQNPE